MSGVLYARVSDSLKQALHDHASKRGLSLTGAVVEVAERGLEAISTGSSVEALEDELERASRELDRTRARLKEAQIRLQAARERDEAINRAYGAVTERMRQEARPMPRLPQARQRY